MSYIRFNKYIMQHSKEIDMMTNCMFRHQFKFNLLYVGAPTSHRSVQQTTSLGILAKAQSTLGMFTLKAIGHGSQITRVTHFVVMTIEKSMDYSPKSFGGSQALTCKPQNVLIRYMRMHHGRENKESVHSSAFGLLFVYVISTSFEQLICV